MTRTTSQVTTLTLNCDWCPVALTGNPENFNAAFVGWHELTITSISGRERRAHLVDLCPKCYDSLGALADKRRELRRC